MTNDKPGITIPYEYSVSGRSPAISPALQSHAQPPRNLCTGWGAAD